MNVLARMVYHGRRLLRRRPGVTVRHTFSFSFLTLAVLGAAVLLSDNESYIRIASDTKSVQAGERFTVSVFAGAHISVNAVDISLAFPDDLVSVTGIDTGESVISLWTRDPYVEGNQVIMQGGTFRRGFIGEHLIAKINFKATGDGVANFTIDALQLVAGDGSGDPVQVTRSDGESLIVVLQNEDGNLNADVGVTFVTDIDGNGNVSLADVQTFMQAWQRREYVYDFNQDNRMNFTDFAIILADSFFQ